MKLTMKFILCQLIILAITLMPTASIYAENQEPKTEALKNITEPFFKDVGTDYWAYSQIKFIVDKKIVTGFGDGTFRPDIPVSRAQFSKMLVLALELNIKRPIKPSFLDVNERNSSYLYIETAKYYLTGYKTSKGNVFKPDNNAVREDMAVAIVKALGLENEKVEDGVLANYTDAGSISQNLRKYVAIAYKHGLMTVSENENTVNTFKPQATLTRATTAVLLCNIIKESEDEKITFDENSDENPIDNPTTNIGNPITYTTPILSSKLENGKIVLTWSRISDIKCQGYKVVLSKNNPTPKYPDDGYLYWITDKNRTSIVLDNKEPYKNGDFGKYLVSGEKYYCSITAVYDDRKIAGNSILITYPAVINENSNTVTTTIPVITSVIEDNMLRLSWNRAEGEGFSYYKVVISKTNQNPKYPEDGYLYYITDKNSTSTLINSEDIYNGGDFGGHLSIGEKYYFSITFVYGDKKVTGNALFLEIPRK